MPRGIIKFDEEKCKGCELCTLGCPLKIIGLNKEKINLSGYNPAHLLEDRCIGCGQCALMCPDLIISVDRERA